MLALIVNHYNFDTCVLKNLLGIQLSKLVPSFKMIRLSDNAQWGDFFMLEKGEKIISNIIQSKINP